MNEFVRGIFSTVCDICDNELLLKRTPTTDKLSCRLEITLSNEGSKTLMHVFDRLEDMDLITELLEGMYTELHEKKPIKFVRIL